MKRPADRRTVLMAAGVAAVAAAGMPVAAQAADIQGAIMFEGGADIPKGQIEIYLEDRAVQDKSRRRGAITRVKSDGSKSVSFSLAAPANPAPSSSLQIVARLERADGWLLARGSAQVEAGSPVRVILNTVMY